MSFDIMLAQRDHIHEWMSLVNMVEDYFPGLNKEDILVTTYRDGDPQGESARALYLRWVLNLINSL